jgi:hypothetical protein
MEQQPQDATTTLRRRFCRGVARNDVAAVQQAMAEMSPEKVVSWMHARHIKGETLLQYAVQHNHLAVMRLVLPHLFLEAATDFTALFTGSPVAVEHLKGAADTASAAGHTVMAQLLQDSISDHMQAWAVSPDGPSPHSMCLAASMGDAALLQRQLATGQTDHLIAAAEQSEAASTAAAVFDIPISHAAAYLASGPKSALEAAIKVGSGPMVQV